MLNLISLSELSHYINQSEINSVHHVTMFIMNEQPFFKQPKQHLLNYNAILEQPNFYVIQDKIFPFSEIQQTFNNHHKQAIRFQWWMEHNSNTECIAITMAEPIDAKCYYFYIVKE